MRFYKDRDGDIQVYIKHEYIGLICPHSNMRKYQCIIDGKVVYYGNYLFVSKIMFVYKYLIKKIFSM